MIPPLIPQPSVAFSYTDADRAAEEWNFNCGPGALCAVLGTKPEDLRPHMGDFERKGYTNPSLMLDVLKRLRVEHVIAYRGDVLRPAFSTPQNALIRVQWDGPWTKPGVPMAARYRKTHWVVARSQWIFDINAIHIGGWITYSDWRNDLVPWLIREAVPRSNGLWFPTHVIEVGTATC